MINVVCVLNEQKRAPYTIDWVVKLKNMVDRYLKITHSFICLTNSDDKRDDIGIIFRKLQNDWRGWWSKMELFSPALAIAGRVLYLDLDVLVVNRLEPIVDYPAEFAIGPAYGNPQVHHKHRVRGVRRGYNSSVMAFTPGEITEQIWEKFIRSPARWMEMFRGDQDFLKQFCPDLEKFPREWIPKLGDCIDMDKNFEPPEQAKVVLCMERNMKKKNIDAVKKYPELRQVWQ